MKSRLIKRDQCDWANGCRIESRGQSIAAQLLRQNSSNTLEYGIHSFNMTAPYISCTWKYGMQIKIESIKVGAWMCKLKRIQILPPARSCNYISRDVTSCCAARTEIEVSMKDGRGKVTLARLQRHARSARCFLSRLSRLVRAGAKSMKARRL